MAKTDDDPIFIDQAGSMRRLDSVCLQVHDQTTGETNYCIDEVTSKDVLDPNAHFQVVQGSRQVLEKCVGIGHMVHSMRFSMPYHTDSMPQFGLLHHHTDALQRDCRPPCSRKARACYFRITTLPKPTTSPCSHHGEFTPFCTGPSSNGAFPTPSGFSEHYPLLLTL